MSVEVGNHIQFALEVYADNTTSPGAETPGARIASALRRGRALARVTPASSSPQNWGRRGAPGAFHEGVERRGHSMQAIQRQGK